MTFLARFCLIIMMLCTLFVAVCTGLNLYVTTHIPVYVIHHSAT